jgi:glycosyltransferase involved in cell wall biosynthesis
MRTLLRSEKYDLVHAHFGHAALIARLQCYAPTVVTYHGSDVMGIVDVDGKYKLKGKLLSFISCAMSLLVHEVIVVSPCLGKLLPVKQYNVIPLGIDFGLFSIIPKKQAREQIGWPQDDFIPLFIALNLSNPVKRFTLAQEAVTQLKGELPINLKTATGLKPEEIPIYMCAADVLLLTSVHEGSPTVVKEALACNLPVVCTEVGDVRDRLRDVEPSFICPPDALALADALRKVFKSGKRSNGREKARFLSEPLVAERVIEVYRKVVKRYPITSH